jgi:putative PIN family toxin of toxin-antitoxin system
LLLRIGRDARLDFRIGIIYDTIMRPRIVLDTNILVAGLQSRRGAAHRLLKLVGTGSFELCLSVGLLFEYESTIKRQDIVRDLSEHQLDAILDYLVASGRKVDIHFLWRPVLQDPSDDLVLEVAVAGECEAIVAYNLRDFLGSKQFGIKALTPAEFLAGLEKKR